MPIVEPRRPSLTELARPGLFGRLRDLVAPNWFTAVMGTGILATAAAGLPVDAGVSRDLKPAALAAWLLAAVLLVGVTGLTAAQWLTRPQLARRHLHHPVLAHFYGAPPMALLTVGAGTLLVGRDWIGLRAAVDVDAALWGLGTLLGLAGCLVVPYLSFTGGLNVTAGPTFTATLNVADGPASTGLRGEPAEGAASPRPPSPASPPAFGGWLMSVVPPMVSASTGALLLPHLPAGQPRLTLLLACYAMFGITLLASIIVITLIWGQLARFGLPEPKMVPTLWIVLGPLGQSVTAAILLGEQAHLAVPAPFSTGLRVFGLVYGVPMLGFALVWMALAAMITARTARTGPGLPFTATWWAFTFPVGTCVTGANGLARLTGADVVTGLAVGLLAGLVTAWFVVAVHTVRSAPWADTTPGPGRPTTTIPAPPQPAVPMPVVPAAVPDDHAPTWAYSI